MNKFLNICLLNKCTLVIRHFWYFCVYLEYLWYQSIKIKSYLCNQLSFFPTFKIHHRGKLAKHTNNDFIYIYYLHFFNIIWICYECYIRIPSKYLFRNYFDGTKLTSVNLSPEPLTAVSFNKTNWRQICVMTDSAITMWNIEQCDSNFLLLPQ